MEYRVNMFNKFKKTQDEQEFIENVDASGAGPMDSSSVHTVLAIYYLAKQIEASSESNDRSSNRMFWLTIVIGFFAACQVIVAIINLFN